MANSRGSRNYERFVTIKVVLFVIRWIRGEHAEETCAHEGGAGEERADAVQQAGGGCIVDGRTTQHPDAHRYGGPAHLLHGHLSVLRRGSQ